MEKKIAIVDDERSIRENIGRYFARSGIAADYYSNAEQVLGIVGQIPYDALITDEKMSLLTGRGLIKLLREKLGNEFPMYLMSGTLSEQEALEAGATGYIPKPFSLSMFDGLIQKLQPSQQNSQTNPEQ